MREEQGEGEGAAACDVRVGECQDGCDCSSAVVSQLYIARRVENVQKEATININMRQYKERERDIKTHAERYIDIHM